MRLVEFWQYDEEGFSQQKNYDADDDLSVLDKTDTRKTRLTLNDINRMRLAAEEHAEQQKHEAEFVQQMYGQPQEAESL